MRTDWRRHPRLQRGDGSDPRGQLAVATGRLATAVALGLVLLLAQAWLAAHELEHLFHHDDGPCATCLIGVGVHAPVPPRPTKSPAPAWVATAEPTFVDRPIQPSGHRPQAARAPPAP